jgi:hypothetical protein
MKTHTPSVLTFALALAAASALTAQATAEDVDVITRTPAVRLQQSSGVEYLNGGAGEQERAVMAPLQNQFPLHIVFSGRGGEYGVADQVRVIGAEGVVATVANAGPLVMFRLPPGRYTVEADIAGSTQKRSVNVGSQVQTLQWSSPELSAAH